MGTTILAWLIAILGLLMIAGGVWDVVDLWNQRRRTVIPLRNWGVAIVIIASIEELRAEVQKHLKILAPVLDLEALMAPADEACNDAGAPGE
jgi:hypothetical protein